MFHVEMRLPLWIKEFVFDVVYFFRRDIVKIDSQVIIVSSPSTLQYALLVMCFCYEQSRVMLIYWFYLNNSWTNSLHEGCVVLI